jgi:hypothetical protein
MRGAIRNMISASSYVLSSSPEGVSSGYTSLPRRPTNCVATEAAASLRLTVGL